MNEIEYFYIKCHYLDFDKKVFSEISAALGIEKFRGTLKISSYGVFPLIYRQKEKKTKVYPDKCDRKFLKLIKVRYYQYKNITFYMKKNRPVKLFVNNRIIVDATYFREANPNYTKASINELEKESSLGNNWFVFRNKDNAEKTSDSVKTNGLEPSEVKGDNLLICSPTVLGFSLGIKLWSEHFICPARSSEAPRKVS